MQIRLLVTILLLNVLVACAAGSSTMEMGPSVTQDNSSEIIKGVTHKSEVLDMFGPPLAVARKGKVMNVQMDIGKDSRKVDSDTFLELFRGNHVLTDRHIVYFYKNSRIEMNGMVVMLAFGFGNHQKSSRLWILINDSTGIVEDYVFRDGE